MVAPPPLALPVRPQTAQSRQSTPGSGRNRGRAAVGFTNRSASDQGVPGGGQQDPDRALSARLPASARSTPRLATDPAPPLSRGSARPPPSPGGPQRRVSSARDWTPRASRDGGNRLATFANPAQGGEDRPMQRQIREKTWGKNVGAELRIMGTNGYVRSSQVRDMVKRLRIDLTPEETTFLAGAELGAPDDFVPVLVLTRALEVPYFDEYDPLHGAREREKGLLGRGITAPRGPTGPRGITRGHLWLGTADVPELFARDPLVPGSAGARAPRKKMDKDGSEAGEEKRQMNELSKQMRNKGMTMLQFFRSIDKDSSGIIDRPEFQQAIQTEEMRSVRAQLDTLWGAIDKDDSGTINYIEMIDALREADAMRPQTRPSTMGTPGQGRITEENRQRASASSRNPRSPLGMNGTARERILPKDHFNLRIPHRTGAPYQTATVVVPIKTSFSYCPDYERYTTMTLENNAISDGSGQAVDIVRTRAANKVERRRQAERRIAVAVDEREAKAERKAESRVCGLSKHRLHWLHMLEAPERGGG